MRVRLLLAGWLAFLAVGGVVAAIVLVSSSEESGSARSELLQTGVPTTTIETNLEPTPTGDPAAGRAVFAAAGCGNCHTLSAAGSTGTIGPDLDTRTPNYVLFREQVQTGGGGMPAYAGILTAQEIEDVVAFVLASAL